MIRFLRAALLAAMTAAPLAAQDTAAPWRTSHFPYFTVSPNDGFYPVMRLIHFRQADPEDRVTLHDAVAVEAGYSTRKSWVLRARGDFPRIAPGWRLEVDGEASVTPHFGDPDAGRQQREQRAINAEVTRRVAGPLLLAARVGFQRLRHQLSCGDAINRYPDAAALAGCHAFPDHGDGIYQLWQNDARTRLAVVLDLRDREFETRNGALLEAGAFTGSANANYGGAYGMARGWISPLAGTHLTARFGFRALSQNGAIGIQHELPLWEHPATVFGGPQSQRGLPLGALAGRGLLLGGAELRQEVWAYRGLAAVSLIAFADGGRVFHDPSPLVDPVPGTPIPSGKLSFTLDDWDWSVGGGVAVRVLRAAQLNITGARRPGGGTTWYVGSGWAW